MKRPWIALMTIAPLGLCGGLYHMYDNSTVESGPLNDYAAWSPSPQEIRSALPAAGTLKERQDKFIALFKNRYRRHEPAMAVGFYFEPKDRIKLMVPARLEPWNMDRLALLTWRETAETFGHPFNIDIYETFIAVKALKVGELRPIPGSPGSVRIVYDFSAPMTMQGLPSGLRPRRHD